MMKSGKGLQEEEEDEDDEFVSNKDAPASTRNAKDGKSSDKANAMRSKHSVTEQRRRSKINERFQTLRELIPNSDQKRDTASFLLEVIHYVQFLQEKEQKYEGSYQPWSSEPTKLMPWRNSHWRAQSFVCQPHASKNGSGPCSSYPGRYDENCGAIPTTLQSSQHNPVDPDLMREASSCRSIEPQSEIANKPMGMPVALQTGTPTNDVAFSQSLSVPASVAQCTEYPMATDAVNHQEELVVEGGTISISSAYSHGLLNSLTQALESTGLDLSRASISVQINLGKRANRGLTPGIYTTEDHVTSGNQPKGPFHDASNSEDFDQTKKRQKI